MKAAALTRTKHNISADNSDGKRRRCAVCLKYTKGYVFAALPHVTASGFNVWNQKEVDAKSEKDRKRYEASKEV